MTGRRTHIRVPVAGRFITPLGEEFASVEALGGIALLLAAGAALVWRAGSAGRDRTLTQERAADRPD